MADVVWIPAHIMESAPPAPMRAVPGEMVVLQVFKVIVLKWPILAKERKFYRSETVLVNGATPRVHSSRANEERPFCRGR